MTAPKRTTSVVKKQHHFKLKTYAAVMALLGMAFLALAAAPKTKTSAPVCHNYLLSVTFPLVKMTGKNKGKTWDAFSFAGIPNKRSKPDILIILNGKSLPVCKNSYRCEHIVTIEDDTASLALFDADFADHDPAGVSRCKPSAGRCTFGEAGSVAVFAKTACH